MNQYSHEAQLLKANGAGWEVHNEVEIENHIEKFILNDVFRRETGLKALQIVENNRGATRRTVKTIMLHI